MTDLFNKKDFIENQFISLIEIKNKEKYYYDLDNKLYSNSSRIDDFNSYLFFHEAGKLISNAILLFEKGYFDCAFYSLRQSLELSVTTLYLISQNDKHEEWNKQKKSFIMIRCWTISKNMSWIFLIHENNFRTFLIEFGKPKKN